MGFYLEVPKNLNKDRQLIELAGAERVLEPSWPPPEGKVLVCVICNGPFDAAGIAFNEQEMEEFAFPDGRPRSWLLIDRSKVLEMCPVVEEYLEC